MDDGPSGRAVFDNFDYGRAIEAECASCGIVQIPSRSAANISCPTCNGELSTNSNNSHHSQVNRSSDHREGNILPHGDGEEANLESLAGLSPIDPSVPPPIRSITTSLQQVSIENTTSGLPLQEGFGESLSFECPSSLGRNPSQWSRLSKTPTEGHDENGSAICQTCDELKSSHECLQCRLAVFKRGIISRKKKSFAIYWIPSDNFKLVFAKICQTEAAAHEGTEIAVVVEEADGSFFVSYHYQLAIKDVLTVSFETDDKKSFSIIGPANVSTFDVQHILARSEERVFPGACVKIDIKYNGEQDALCEGKVRMPLVTGKAKWLITIPTKSPTPGIHYLRQYLSVTAMPQLDRETLQSCHVGLIENIGDFSSLCSHLYQCNILTADDKAFLKSFQRPSDGVDQLLMLVPKKGNVLDIFISILQKSRENQEAAKILVQKRLQLHGNCK